MKNRLPNNANRLFYFVVLGVSLTGAGIAARGWLNWWAPFAFLAVGAVELGGVALSVHADNRRQLGERAIPARILSGCVAVGAASVNYFGHVAEPFQAYFFCGVSTLGYSVWLIDSAARRRDALRSLNLLAATPPVYGITQWVKHPGITRRARDLAVATPSLGRVGSLIAARESFRVERRSAAISDALRKRITNHIDPTLAVIAVNTYDLDEIAKRLAAGADYDGLTAILSAELVPSRLHAEPDSDEDMPKPLSDAAAIDWSSMSGTQAVQAAALALGDVPASVIKTWLSENAGKDVSESLIRQARRKLNGEYENRWTAEDTLAANASYGKAIAMDAVSAYPVGLVEGFTLADLLPVPVSPMPVPAIPVDPAPLCPDEFHGADGGSCPTCNYDPYRLTEPDTTAVAPSVGKEVVLPLDLTSYPTIAAKIRATNDALTVDGMDAPTVTVIRSVLNDHGINVKPSQIERALKSNIS